MITPPYAGRHSAQRSRVSPVGRTKNMPARQPLEMPGRYCFHSTLPAPWKRVSAALSVDRQSKSGVNFSRTRQCFSVSLSRSGKAWEDRPDRAICHIRFVPGTQRGSRRSPCVMPRGSFRPSVSLLSGDLLDHELPSVERDRVTGALALQLSIDRCLGGDPMISLPSHKLACRHGIRRRRTTRRWLRARSQACEPVAGHRSSRSRGGAAA